MDRTRYLIRNTGILTISNFASKLLGFFLVPLYTSVLSTVDVGTYDLVVSTVSLLFPLLTLNIVDALMRFLMDGGKSKDEVTRIGIKFVNLSLIPVALFLAVASRLDALGSIHGYELFIFFYYAVSCLNQYLIQFAKGMEMVPAMGVAGVIGTVATLCANLLFLLVLKLKLKKMLLKQFKKIRLQ